jgi:hypothetical protein
MTTDTTTAAPSLSDEASNALQREMHRALSEARRAVLAPFIARFVGQTVTHPDMPEVLCTITRAMVDTEDIVTVDATFTNPETGEVEAGTFVI